MKRNSRLSLALLTLGHMAGKPDVSLTSGEIAAYAGTNPVVVRRVLGMLRKAGLLISTKGHAGGWKLACSPQNISLADIYLALDERLIGSDQKQDKARCSLEHVVQRQVSSVMEDIETSLVERLSTTTIADICKTVDCHCL